MGADPSDAPAGVRDLAGFAESPALQLGGGALSVLVGVLVLAWPGATVAVIAWLFAVQLIVAGVLQLVSAFGAGRGGGGRVLSVLLGWRLLKAVQRRAAQRMKPGSQSASGWNSSTTARATTRAATNSQTPR